MSWLGDVAQWVAKWELQTWAGFINLVGLVLVGSKSASSGTAERAMFYLGRMVEGRRKFKAKMKGKKYKPVLKGKHRPPPADDQMSIYDAVTAIVVFLIVCVAVIAATKTADIRLSLFPSLIH